MTEAREPGSLRSNGSMTVRVERLDDAPAPIDAFLRCADLPYVVFLDSAVQDDARGRYSYLSAAPFEVLTARQRDLRIETARSADLAQPQYETASSRVDDLFGAVATALRPWSSTAIDGLPPLTGGAIGLFGYGLNRTIERVAASRHDEFALPDLAVGLYDWVLAWDHATDECHLVSHGYPARGGAARDRRARDRARQVRDRISKPRAPSTDLRDRCHPASDPSRALTRGQLAPSWSFETQPRLASDFSRDDYLEAVERCVEYIRAGDVFQVNLSQRIIHPLDTDPVEFYTRLRASNPAPFAGYLDLGTSVVASSSPEQFLSLEPGGVVVTRPIKGTRSRGYTPEEDAYRGALLRESEKDRAENVMIVDLLRNDLSRVCKPRSVVVPRLFELEHHPTVHHLVSEVRGVLRDGYGALDLLRASFPGGSITGAPKVRAMEIIAELEPTARGPYCGSIAWIGFDGRMGSSILIRTATLARGWIQLPAGGGIIADSNPTAEYRETLDKITGMVRALA